MLRNRILDYYSRLNFRRKMVTRGLLITLTLLVIILSLTYYGINVGNFVITVEKNRNESLALTIDENHEEFTSRLTANNLKNAIDADYSYIPSNITEGLGSKNDENNRYFAYSFYLVNTGSVSVGYNMSFKIIESSKRLNSILRVMIISDRSSNVYAMSRDEEPEPIISERENNIIGYTIPFINEKDIIIQETIHDMMAGDYIKYTIIMWLDGWDTDQTNDMFGGKLKTEITFTIIH